MKTLITLSLIFLFSCAQKSNRKIASLTIDESLERINNLNHEISENVLKEALENFKKHEDKIKNKRYLSIIDYSKHSSEKRFYIIDLETEETTSFLVSHGIGNDRNDDGMADTFPNRSGVKSSPLGSFIVGQFYRKVKRIEYFGLRITGLDRTNSYVANVGVVIQTSTVTPSLINPYGKTIRSWGSYVVKKEKFMEIKDLIEDGTFLYVGK